MEIIYILLSPALNYGFTISLETFIIMLQIMTIALNIMGIFYIRYLTKEY